MEDELATKSYNALKQKFEFFTQKFQVSAQLMSFDSKMDLLEVIMFDEKNFYKLVDWLMTNVSLGYTKILKTALQGAIRHNNLDMFKKYAEKLSVFNCSRACSFLNADLNDVFKEFFILRSSDDLDETFLTLLDAWQSFQYVSNKSQMVCAKQFMKNVKGASSTWRAYTVNISNNGVCDNGSKLPPVKYSQKDLHQFADLLKNSFENKNTRSLFEESLLRLEHILKEHKFDVIIDGLNNGLGRHNNFADNFQKLFNNLELDKKYLITLRYHFYKKNQVYFDELKNVVDYEFLFTERMLDDDLFIIYAALRNDAYIVSNDEFSNYIVNFSEYSYIFKNWLKSRLIKRRFNYKDMYLDFPTNFYHFTQKVQDNRWIVPFYSDLTVPSVTDFPNKFMCFEKIKN